MRWLKGHSLLLALAATVCLRAAAQTPPPATPPDADPLSLEVEAATQAPAKQSPLRLAIEAGAGRVDLRGGGQEGGRLVSIDARLNVPLDAAWRFGLSNRYDYIDPPVGGQRNSTNSLREAFVGWQEPGGDTAAEAGRLNHRQGPAYGFNPTDYFRTSALRSVTTADPVALRERRLGVVMVRVNRLWDDGGLTVAVAPRLDNAPSRSAASTDLGATNSSHRALASTHWRVDKTMSLQGSLYGERGQSAQLGGSFTMLVTDSLVGFAELSYGRAASLFERIAPVGAAPQRRHQSAAGLTYTFNGGLALTLEADYNGHGLDKHEYARLLALGPAAYQRYFEITQASQELGPRHAWLVYASQKGLGLRQLDLTAFVRTNSVDHSRLWWAEFRYHWGRVDGVLQWQRSQGRAGSEFGVLPVRQSVQVSAVLYL